MYIAVVLGKDGVLTSESNRPHGDWAAFVGNTKEEASNKALSAAFKWSSEPSRQDKPRLHRNAPYRVFVGELAAEATFPIAFTNLYGYIDPTDPTLDEQFQTEEVPF